MDLKTLFLRLSMVCSVGVVVCGLLTAFLNVSLTPALAFLGGVLLFRILQVLAIKWEHKE